MIEVIIPAMMPPQPLIESLSLQDRRPDLVTIVSNEVFRLDTFGLDVRIIRFASDRWCIGDSDVVLRRNIGIWSSEADLIVFQDDDQIASSGMLSSSEALLAQHRVFWGHHRFLDFAGMTVTEVMALPPHVGKTRELPPNHKHGWQSCYAGMFGARRDFLLEVGGFDMAFMGRHGSEDQHLGRRMLAFGEGAGNGWFIHEPPFAWHPLVSPVRPPAWRNACCDHRIEDRVVEGRKARVCARCPFIQVDIDADQPLAYDPSSVDLTIVTPR